MKSFTLQNDYQDWIFYRRDAIKNTKEISLYLDGNFWDFDIQQNWIAVKPENELFDDKVYNFIRDAIIASGGVPKKYFEKDVNTDPWKIENYIAIDYPDNWESALLGKIKGD